MNAEVNRWTLVFNDLCRQAITSGKMVINSSGKQHRNFITLHDVAAVVAHFLFTVAGNWGDGLYNLGGDGSLSIAEAAKTIARVYKKKYGKPIPVETTGEDDREDHHPVLFNIDKLKKTGFCLTGNMEKEIDQTLSLCEVFTT
jgi:UDP-glucose 4-epimerase